MKSKTSKNTGMVHQLERDTHFNCQPSICAVNHSSVLRSTRQPFHQQSTSFLLPISPLSGALPERPQSAQEMRSSGQPVFLEPPRQKSQQPLAMTEPSAAFLAATSRDTCASVRRRQNRTDRLVHIAERFNNDGLLFVSKGAPAVRRLDTPPHAF